MIESNSVVIIHGATGSGKSTQLPQYILDHYAQRSAFCNIVVTQPRKIGASSIARWISKERSWTLGGLVGYQVRHRKSMALLVSSFRLCKLMLECNYFNNFESLPQLNRREGRMVLCII